MTMETLFVKLTLLLVAEREIHGKSSMMIFYLPGLVVTALKIVLSYRYFRKRKMKLCFWPSAESVRYYLR